MKRNPFSYYLKRAPRKKRIIVIIKVLILILLFTLFAGLGAITGVLISYIRDLPSLEPLESYAGAKWELPTKVYALNGELIGEFFQEKRELVALSQIPQRLIEATIAIEDRQFFIHKGISFKGIIRAFLTNIRAGGIREGGSSITQQLVKLLFLTREKTYQRKVQEAILAIKVERMFTKEEILERYFNKIYFGHGVYGVEAASSWYFGKHVEDLNLVECALLAGLIKAPNRYSPITHPKAAEVRQKAVLRGMAELGYISKEEANSAHEELKKMLKEGKIKGSLSINQAPYFMEFIRQRLEEKYGANILYKGGLRVHTTLDLKMQEAAEKALSSSLDRLNKNRKGKRIEGALIALDPRTGYIKAMVGGSGFTSENQLNRAVQARRQPGSAFKPFLYAAAIDKGFTPADTLRDEPVSYPGARSEWTPQNYDGKFHGLVTLRKALEHSINVASVRLMEEVTPIVTIEYAKRMGIKSRLEPYLSLALGTSEVTPLEMASAFGVFANQGIRVEPMWIRHIKNVDGVLLEENLSLEEEVLPGETAYILTDMMEGVVKRGTARRAIGEKFSRPAAGKTGTSSDFADAWFVGFTPDLVAAAWIGYDRRISLGKHMAGGTVAAPIWREFMELALEGTPVSEFPVPEDICFVDVCSKSGLLPQSGCLWRTKEVFLRGTEPADYCQRHQFGESYLPELVRIVEEGEGSDSESDVLECGEW